MGTYTIERQHPTYGDGLDKEWTPLVTLHDFTTAEAQDRLKGYAKRYGAGRVRMLRRYDIERDGYPQ